MWRDRRGRKDSIAPPVQPATPEIERLDAVVREALSALVRVSNDPHRIGQALAAFTKARAAYERAFAQLPIADALKEALRMARSEE